MLGLFRQHHCLAGVRCPGCDSDAVTRDGHDDTQPARQRYRCKTCARRFDNLTGTVLAGHHQPLRVWAPCLCFMGLNLSNRQIATELRLGASDVQAMTEQLRSGWVAKAPAVAVALHGEVEVNAVHVVAGHKGQLERWQKGAIRAMPQTGRSAGSRHAGEGQAPHPRPDPARRTGDAAHAGERATGYDQPIITGAVAAGSLIHTDDYGIYARLQRWGYGHKTVCHGRGQ